MAETLTTWTGFENFLYSLQPKKKNEDQDKNHLNRLNTAF